MYKVKHKKYKEFKPFDKVLYRTKPFGRWRSAFYDMFFQSPLNEEEVHKLQNRLSVTDDNIIPYLGNESLHGTCNEPQDALVVNLPETIRKSLQEENKTNTDNLVIVKLPDSVKQILGTEESSNIENFLSCQKDIEPDFKKVIDDNFWDLVD